MTIVNQLKISAVSIKGAKALEQNLLEKISKEKYKPHDLFLSLEKISNIYNVNKTTAQRALHSLVGKNYLYQIHGKGTFVAPPAVTFQVLVIADYETGTNNDFGSIFGIPAFLRGVLKKIDLEKYNYSPVMLTKKKFIEILPDIELIYRSCRGVIFFRNIDIFVKTLPVLKDKNIPSFFYGSDALLESVSNADCLVYNEGGITDLAINHLLKLSHKKISYLYIDESPTQKKRFNLFLQENKKYKFCTENDILYFKTIKELIHNNIIPDIKRLLKNGITAIICGQEEAGVYFLNKCLMAGIKIPGELSVLTISNYPICALTPVPLSAVHIPIEEDAGRCLELLIDIIEHGSKSEKHISKTTIVRRLST
ncbi:MAG: hypothetical protein A2096_01390 [Spirochaetes bacterium GWF1_41_5]|nr:MAG: hypothetical protein A2096_01390 [Spirochaetes bacterium GWF1_41_5]HBE01999.1 hypothetical protein [Spirochaetia bacterium]